MTNLETGISPTLGKLLFFILLTLGLTVCIDISYPLNIFENQDKFILVKLYIIIIYIGALSFTKAKSDNTFWNAIFSYSILYGPTIWLTIFSQTLISYLIFLSSIAYICISNIEIDSNEMFSDKILKYLYGLWFSLGIAVTVSKLGFIPDGLTFENISQSKYISNIAFIISNSKIHFLFDIRYSKGR